MPGVKLSIIIVNWDTKDLLARCLDSVYTRGYEVIVIDNGSSDGSVSLVKERFPEVRLIQNSDNLGFAVANNKALGEARGEYVLFLNTDVILTEGAIEGLLEFMDNHPKAALCTPSLLREDGSQQEAYISFPTLATELFGRISLRKKRGPCRVESVRGACMMARRSVINKMGGFDERYFLFLEETDLCLRLHRGGYEVWYLPDVQVYHTGGGSAEKDRIGARIEYWRSRYIFFRKNYSWFRYILLNLGLSIKLILDLILNIFGNKSRIYRTILLWHILGKPGDWGIGSRPAIERVQPIDGVLIKENKSRRLLLCNNTYIKQYKSIFKRPWLVEWRLINRLRQLDIPTVRPIACGKRYLVTERLENIKTLHEFILEDNINFNEKLILTKSLAGFLNKLHKKGIYHGDLHAGNILVERKNGGFGFYITDLHRARIKLYLSKRDIINNLVQLDKFFSIEVSKSTRLRFLKYYGYRRYAREIAIKTEFSCHKLWRKRDRLYLKKDKYGIWRGKYIVNPAYKDIPNILGYVKPGHGEVIKEGRSSYLSRFNIPGIGGVVLKIYKRKRHGLRSWCSSWSLITRGVRTPQPIAAGKNFIVTEDVKDAENLTIFSRKNEMPGKLPSYVKTLHDRGIFPRDMKGSNILIDKNKDIYLVDLDHIRIRRRIPLISRLYNVLQVKRSTGLSCLKALPVRRILIVKPSSLGDIIQALPVAGILRRQFPSSSVWWLANSNYTDLLRLVPSIDKIIPFERERWRYLRGLIKFFRNIRKLNFDMVLDPQGLFRSGFITWISGAPLRIGFGRAREFADLFYNKRIYTDRQHAQERYLALVEDVSGALYEETELDIPIGVRNWADSIYGNAEVCIVINPGSRWATKRWYSNRYAELIDRLNSRYDAKIILIGDRDDIAIANDIKNQISDSIVDLTSKTTLVELTAILNRCDVLVTNDSGPMHLADFLGKPIVAIFGPTDPGKTGPIGQRNRIIKASVSCSPCFKKNCKELLCMDGIGVQDVLLAVEEVLQKQKVVV